MRQSGILAAWLMGIEGLLFRDDDPQWEQYMYALGSSWQPDCALPNWNGNSVIQAKVCCICKFAFVYE